MQDSFQQRVRLFKKIILFGTASIIAVLLIVCTVLAVKCAGLANRSRQYESDMKILQGQVESLNEKEAISRSEIAKLEQKLSEKREKDDPTFDYQTKYPDLYVQRGERIEPAEKTVYLTFDDGPSGNTKGLLNILDQYNVKATFFVVGYQINGREDVLKDIAARGHTIGIHTDSHNYNKIYSSVDSYLDDFYSASQKIEEITGQKPEIFRFPGGSINSYNGDLYNQLVAEMVRRGYTYYDWNVSAQDAVSPPRTKAQIVESVVSGVHNSKRSVVLMHDSDKRETSIYAADTIIKTLQDEGYSFLPLNKNVVPVDFAY